MGEREKERLEAVISTFTYVIYVLIAWAYCLGWQCKSTTNSSRCELWLYLV